MTKRGATEETATPFGSKLKVEDTVRRGEEGRVDFDPTGVNVLQPASASVSNGIGAIGEHFRDMEK